MFIIFKLVKRLILLVFFASLAVLLLSSRCSTGDNSLFSRVASLLPGANDSSTAVPAAAEPLLETLHNQVAEELGIAPDLVKVTAVEPRIWTNTCMGVTRRGVICEEKITPGFKVSLEAAGQKLDYRLSEQGRILRAN